MKKKKDGNDVSMQTLRKVLKLIGRYRLLLLLSILLAGLTVVLQLYVPVLFGDGIDRIAGEGLVDFAGLGGIFGKILVLIILSSVASFVMNVINNRLAFRTVQDIRARAIRKIETLPLSYIDSHSSGDLVQRIIAEVPGINRVLYDFTPKPPATVEYE